MDFKGKENKKIFVVLGQLTYTQKSCFHPQVMQKIASENPQFANKPCKSVLQYGHHKWSFVAQYLIKCIYAMNLRCTYLCISMSLSLFLHKKHNNAINIFPVFSYFNYYWIYNRQLDNNVKMRIPYRLTFTFSEP